VVGVCVVCVCVCVCGVVWCVCVCVCGVVCVCSATAILLHTCIPLCLPYLENTGENHFPEVLSVSS